MRKALVRSLVTTSFLMLCSGVASAQTPNQPPPDPPKTTAPPPTPPPPATSTASTLPAAPPPRYKEGKEHGEDYENDEGRLRIGFDFFGGTGTGNETSGPTIGVTFRVGYQLQRLMAVYANLSAFVWFGSTDRTYQGQSFDLSAIGGYHFTPMFSLTPLDWLEIAAGPSLDKIAGGSSKTDFATENSSAVAYSGFYFGLHGRVAFHIGGRPNPQTGRRVSFTIGLDLHPTFAEGTTVTLYTIGLGADWY